MRVLPDDTRRLDQAYRGNHHRAELERVPDAAEPAACSCRSYTKAMYKPVSSRNIQSEQELL